MKALSSHLTIPVKLQFLSVIQAFVRENASLTKIANREITRFNIAVEEAVTNVINHAFLPEEEASFDVLCQITPVQFTIIIRDQGLPFDPSQIDEFTPHTAEDSLEQKGLGFRLMKGSVDALSFHNLGFGGKEVHLVKYIEGTHIDQLVNASQMQEYRHPEKKQKQETIPVPFHIEMLQPHQAIEISQCAYRTYGYSYIMENIYYPERLIDMTKSGTLISAVVVTDDTGEMMSHCALERFGSKWAIPEIGMAFTKPKFRGQGCLTKLNIRLMDTAREQNIKGIFAKAVTTHPFSQKALIRATFKECAILIGLSPAKTFSKMEKQGAQRESLILFYLKLMKTPSVELFTNATHQSIITEIYHHLGLDADVCIARQNLTAPPQVQQSELTIEVFDSLNYANIFIGICSENIVLELKQRIRELCQKKMEAINLYLNMCDEYVMSYVQSFEKLGFFFAGAFPNDEKHFLVMQYLNNLSMDYSKIAAMSDFATRLLSYVQEQDINQ